MRSTERVLAVGEDKESVSIFELPLGTCLAEKILTGAERPLSSPYWKADQPGLADYRDRRLAIVERTDDAARPFVPSRLPLSEVIKRLKMAGHPILNPRA